MATNVLLSLLKINLEKDLKITDLPCVGFGMEIQHTASNGVMDQLIENFAATQNNNRRADFGVICGLQVALPFGPETPKLMRMCRSAVPIGEVRLVFPVAATFEAVEAKVQDRRSLALSSVNAVLTGVTLSPMALPEKDKQNRLGKNSYLSAKREFNKKFLGINLSFHLYNIEMEKSYFGEQWDQRTKRFNVATQDDSTAFTPSKGGRE